MKALNTVEPITDLNNPIILFHSGREQCKPLHSFGPAIRPHYLIHYILSGKGNYYVNGTSYQLSKGNAFLITPGITTLYSADEQDPWEYCWIGFGGYEAKTILQNCGFTQNNLVYTDNSKSELEKTLLTLIQTFEEGKGNEYTYLGLLYSFFSHMRTSPSISSQQYSVTYLNNALDYIHNNYTYDIKILDLAKYIGIDRTYLYKLFITYKKESPQEYLINYRLKIAQMLLKESELSITEVAYSSGFRDAPSFNKHFKNFYHITPQQYRYNKSPY